MPLGLQLVGLALAGGQLVGLAGSPLADVSLPQPVGLVPVVAGLAVRPEPVNWASGSVFGVGVPKNGPVARLTVRICPLETGAQRCGGKWHIFRPHCLALWCVLFLGAGLALPGRGVSPHHLALSALAARGVVNWGSVWYKCGGPQRLQRSARGNSVGRCCKGGLYHAALPAPILSGRFFVPANGGHHG